MTAKGQMRGNPVYWDESDQKWKWEDTSEPAVFWGGDERPCTACNRTADPNDGVGGADPCLGVIEGVDAACCGHGVEPPQIVLRCAGSGCPLNWGSTCTMCGKALVALSDGIAPEHTRRDVLREAIVQADIAAMGG